LWFKGEIRKRSLGFNEKYKEKMSKIRRWAEVEKMASMEGDIR
jgi:hypothetical protein